jgi:hypothetical protein
MLENAALLKRLNEEDTWRRVGVAFGTGSWFLK